jgi:NADH:ubiquinone oxidoreductase subunit K
MSAQVLNVSFVGVLGLLAVGLYGLLVLRNLVKLLIALQILVKAAVLGLVVAGNASDQINLSQTMAVTVIVADTVVAVVALAMIIQIRRHLGTVDVRDLSELQG